MSSNNEMPKYIEPKKLAVVSPNITNQLEDDVCNSSCQNYVPEECTLDVGLKNIKDKRNTRCMYFYHQKAVRRLAKEAGIDYRIFYDKNELSLTHIEKIKKSTTDRDSKIEEIKNISGFLKRNELECSFVESNLFLIGVNGIGKTTLAIYIAVSHAVNINRPLPIALYRYSDIEWIESVDILILDEVRLNQESEMILLRYINRHPKTRVIMTSNHRLCEVIQDNSILSRLQLMEVTLLGQDYRRIKAKNKKNQEVK